jgi:hypothetical protein
MFESLAEPALLSELACAQRDERRAVGRRLLAAGRLCQRRMAAVAFEDRGQWCVDNWEAVAAEVAAELGISRSRASSQMSYGVELLERLPKLGAALVAGAVDFRVVAIAVYRTGLITDAKVLAVVDAVFGSRERWHLARCYALPRRMKRAKMDEIRLSMGRDPI